MKAASKSKAPRKPGASEGAKGTIAKPPGPTKKNPENLKRRAEWFQRRASKLSG